MDFYPNEVGATESLGQRGRARCVNREESQWLLHPLVLVIQFSHAPPRNTHAHADTHAHPQEEAGAVSLVS